MKPSKSLSAVALALLASVSINHAAVTYTGSGTSGFGGPVGQSSMVWDDDGSTVTVSFTKGPGAFNDTLVLYFDTGTTGRTTIDSSVNDRQDTNRAAISYMDAATGHSLNFSSGFEASHAIAINPGFGGLWSIPSTGSIGNDDLDYIATVNSDMTSNTDDAFTFSFSLSDLGLSSGDTFEFVGIYLNPFGGGGQGFSSDEGFGGGFPTGNIGQASFSFTSALSYTAVPEPSAALLGALACIPLLRRRR